MANIPEQIYEQVSNLPNSGRYLLAAPVIAAVAMRSWLKDRKESSASKDELASNYGNHDDNVLEQAISMSESNNPGTNLAYDTRRRLGPRTLMTAGFAIFAASLVTHPTTEIVSQNSNQNIAIALDSSLAMQNTSDMSNHQTRFDAAIQGIKDSNYSGNLSVVQFGANTYVSVPMGKKNNNLIDAVKKNTNIDQNGANAVAGLSVAASGLPNEANNPAKKNGEVILISDGVLDSTSNSQQIAEETMALTMQGIDVKVIIPGKSPASYNYGGTNFPSSVSENIFSSFGSKNIDVVTSHETIASAINSDQLAVGSSKNTQNWYPPYILGAALVYAGYAKYGRKVRKVTV